jgi:cytochrome c oxidase assembly factor CtaG
MKPFFKLLLGVIALLVGLGFVMPAVAQWRTQGSLPAVSVVLLGLGLVLAAAGVFAGVSGFRRLKS